MGECCSDGLTTAVTAVMVGVSMMVMVVSAGLVAAPAPPRSQESESILLSRYPGQEEFKSEYRLESVWFVSFNVLPVSRQQRLAVHGAHNIC